MRLTAERMRELGNRSMRFAIPEEDLDDHIEALKLVMAYLDGRTDCGLVVNGLRRDLSRFIDYKEAR